MSLPLVTRFGADPLLDLEVANKRYVDSSGGGGSDNSCKVTNSVAQSVPNNTVTTITWDTESYDTDAFHDTVTNPSRLTIPAGLAGKYLILAGSRWALSAVGSRQTRITQNGTLLCGNFFQQFNQCLSSASIIIDLAVGDFVEQDVFQNTGASLNFDGQLGGAFLQLQKIDQAG